MFFKNSLISGAIFCLFTASIYSYDPAVRFDKNEKPKELEGVGVQEKLGNQLDLSLSFRDETGKSVLLSSFFKRDKPVLLSLVYYKCPTLCNFHLNGVTDTLKKLSWQVGNEFEYVAVSFDPRETFDLAFAKKNAYLKEYTRGNGQGWHFLTGDQKEITALAESLGFSYKWNSENEQWIHSSVAYIITPSGKISRYLHGITFDERNLKLSLLEASDGKIGDFTDQFALFCFQFDPGKNTYTLYAYNIMKLGGFFTLLIMAAFLIPFWIRHNRNSELIRKE